MVPLVTFATLNPSFTIAFVWISIYLVAMVTEEIFLVKFGTSITKLNFSRIGEFYWLELSNLLGNFGIAISIKAFLLRWVQLLHHDLLFLFILIIREGINIFDIWKTLNSIWKWLLFKLSFINRFMLVLFIYVRKQVFSQIKGKLFLPFKQPFGKVSEFF